MRECSGKPMNPAQAKDIEDWYHGYVARFKTGAALHPMHLVKHEHSLRVAGEAEGLARELGWPEDDVRAARAMGLLHDIGRFSQFDRFGTLMDAKSVNHAVLGFEVLTQEGALSALGETDRRKILDGVRFHNAKSIPSDLAAESLCFLRLIRDADKLDIFLVLNDAIVTGKIREHPELLLGGTLEGKANPRLVESVKHGHMASPVEIKCLTDLCLFQLGWVFDINFPETMRRIRERETLEKIIRHLPADTEVREAARSALGFRDKALAGQAACRSPER